MKSSGRARRTRQRGVVLIFTLIVLLILTIGAVALMRSMNTSLNNAGNLAFREDLVNQGELAVSQVTTQFLSGALSTSASTQADNPALNYYAEIQSTSNNNKGIPNVLLTSVPNSNPITGASGVTMYYVIERLCEATGATVPNQCAQSDASSRGGSINGGTPLMQPSATFYRLSVRVNGPRNTQVFLQSTLARAD